MKRYFLLTIGLCLCVSFIFTFCWAEETTTPETSQYDITEDTEMWENTTTDSEKEDNPETGENTTTDTEGYNTAEESGKYNITSILLTGAKEDAVLKEILSLYPRVNVWSVFHSSVNFDIKPNLRFNYSSYDTYMAFNDYSLVLLYTSPNGERNHINLENSRVSLDGSLSFVTYEGMCEQLEGIREFDLAVVTELLK